MDIAIVGIGRKTSFSKTFLFNGDAKLQVEVEERVVKVYDAKELAEAGFEYSAIGC